MPAKGSRPSAPGGSPQGLPAAKELDDATLERLQHQLLEDDEFADDMRALLLARFRAKHHRKTAGGAPAEDGSEASDEHSSDESGELESDDPDHAELNRLKELGYELQPHERVLSKGMLAMRHEALLAAIVCTRLVDCSAVCEAFLIAAALLLVTDGHNRSWLLCLTA